MNQSVLLLFADSSYYSSPFDGVGSLSITIVTGPTFVKSLAQRFDDMYLCNVMRCLAYVIVILTRPWHINMDLFGEKEIEIVDHDGSGLYSLLASD